MVTDDAGHGIYEEFDEIGSAGAGPVDHSGPAVPVIPIAPIVPLCGEERCVQP